MNPEDIFGTDELDLAIPQLSDEINQYAHLSLIYPHEVNLGSLRSHMLDPSKAQALGPIRHGVGTTWSLMRDSDKDVTAAFLAGVVGLAGMDVLVDKIDSYYLATVQTHGLTCVLRPVHTPASTAFEEPTLDEVLEKVQQWLTPPNLVLHEVQIEGGDNSSQIRLTLDERLSGAADPIVRQAVEKAIHGFGWRSPVNFA